MTHAHELADGIEHPTPELSALGELALRVIEDTPSEESAEATTHNNLAHSGDCRTERPLR